MKWILLFIVLLFCTAAIAVAEDTPRPEDFLVLAPMSTLGPKITPYLKYQVNIAWQQDEIRRKRFEQLRDEGELLRLQQELREKLLAMLGGLPRVKTPLHPQITGRIQMDGFHIEKLIFQSLPGVYVTALLYVPDGGNKHPGILVPCGHSPAGKAYYQALAQRLVHRGYVVISWDPVGQGERSQFWDAKQKKSRYNLICAEHAIMGNLAYLAGTNLARWEIWDGIRAVDYLLTRPEVDPERINITGTSGGGTQTALIAALDPRIKVVVPSCYITSLPMRMYNRIFKDPDSDPEQDLYGMISEGLDHSGLLLLMYPRPVFVAAAVLDFFPIEGTHKTFREVASLYSRFGHADRIAMTEGYHEHQYSVENQRAAINFLDHFNGLPTAKELPAVKELDVPTLQCTRTGQVMTDYDDAKSLMDEIRDYSLQHKSSAPHSLKELYYGKGYPEIRSWGVGEYKGGLATDHAIEWEAVANTKVGEISIDKYLLHHSGELVMPLLHIYRRASRSHNLLLWFSSNGKAGLEDWSAITKYLDAGYAVVSFDFRGLGETRMPYKAVSPDDPLLGHLNYDAAYVNPLSSVLAEYVYNSLLIGRPYFFQMMEDVEIASLFVQLHLKASQISVVGEAEAASLATSAAQVLPELTPPPRSEAAWATWSEIVDEKREIWPIQYLLPDGAARMRSTEKLESFRLRRERHEIVRSHVPKTIE
jgi:cephalosporin-C deacetylase-like acetyl esterase